MESLQSKELTSVINAEDIKKQLLHLGIKQGDVLEVHASMKAIGYILGGSNTVLDAILDVIGYEGTLVMAAQAYGNSEPAYFEHPPVDIGLYHKIRNSHPVYQSKFEDLRYMGALATSLQKRPAVYFSNHPIASFMSIGKHAKWITQSHPLNDEFGLRSPLARMVELKAKVLLIGVDYDSCTGMHLGEHLSGKRPLQIQGSRMNVAGKEEWVKFLTHDYDSDDFKPIGRAMEMQNKIQAGLVGNAVTKVFDLETAVRFTQKYFEENL